MNLGKEEMEQGRVGLGQSLGETQGWSELGRKGQCRGQTLVAGLGCCCRDVACI